MGRLDARRTLLSIISVCAISMTLAACNGSGGPSANSASGSQAATDAVTLNWTPPATYSNGTSLPPADLAGFHIYYGTNSSDLTNMVDVPATTSTSSYTINGLAPGTYYFAMTAYDSQGHESGLSNEVSKTVG